MSRGALDRPLARRGHELVIAVHVGSNERPVMRAQPFQLGGKREGEHDVGAGQQCEMQIGLLGDLGPQRVDHDKTAALAHGLTHVAHKVQVGDRGVAAPDDVELGVGSRLGPDAGHEAVGASPRLTPDRAAHRAPVELAGAQAMEKAQ